MVNDPGIILDDVRQIAAMNVSGNRWCVGELGVTAIEPYLEFGQMARVIWFAVYCDDVVVCRVNSVFVEYICYCTN